MRDVPAATWPMTTDVAALAMPGMRVLPGEPEAGNPAISAWREGSVLRNAYEASLPATMGERSRTESLTIKRDRRQDDRMTGHGTTGRRRAKRSYAFAAF